MSGLRSLTSRAWHAVRGSPVKVEPLGRVNPDGLGKGLRITLWHQFVKPPYGGGNQFMMALKAAFLAEGAKVYDNRLRDDVVHLCNSTWFDVPRFEAFQRRRRAPMVHRIDGPITLYRDRDAGRQVDEEVFAINGRLASATVLQSQWSSDRLRELGFHAVAPTIIHNAVDDRIFHPRGRVPWDPDRKLRIISTAWSPNPRKGGPIFKWLDEHLDFGRVEYTLLGRSSEPLRNIRQSPPVASEGVADALRQHDVYLMASQNECCSNALIEALACGLPVLYMDSGGNPELVGRGGLPFQQAVEVPALLDKLVADYAAFKANIRVETLASVAARYLKVLRSVAEAER